MITFTSVSRKRVGKAERPNLELGPSVVRAGDAFNERFGDQVRDGVLVPRVGDEELVLYGRRRQLCCSIL